jgi:hypothetical protein
MPLVYVRKFSHDMLLNIIYTNAYFSVHSILFKSGKSRDKANDPAHKNRETMASGGKEVEKDIP